MVVAVCAGRLGDLKLGVSCRGDTQREGAVRVRVRGEGGANGTRLAGGLPGLVADQMAVVGQALAYEAGELSGARLPRFPESKSHVAQCSAMTRTWPVAGSLTGVCPMVTVRGVGIVPPEASYTGAQVRGRSSARWVRW